MKDNEKGIALIMVLWVMVLLIALGTEFALSMKTEVNITRNFKEDIEAYYIAKAGINLAKAEILSDSQFHSWTEEKGYIFGPVVSGIKDEGNLALPGEGLEVPEPPKRTELPLGKGFIHYSIRDENGKININTASRDVLTKALAANGLSLGSERDTIVDSILDWIDPDNRHRVNGAESDYYRGLSPAYSAKNGLLDSVEELLKVKGVTPELFYGSEEYQVIQPSSPENAPGLARIFTVQKVAQFNPNTAERVVLEIMYPDNQVEEILAKKEERGWYNQSKSTHFEIEATGTFEHSPTQHTMVAIIEKQSMGDKATLLTRYWNDNLIRR
ncbi:MAG: general secretion pathway protein GspK [Nitrospinae bacterium]|nr:general secretion pathway protein GspK [Nitrospinota bacterium]